MIELGKKQVLYIRKIRNFGVYVSDAQDIKGDHAILLPGKYVPEGADLGDGVEVFVYRDSSDRLVATTLSPALTLGETAVLTVKDTGTGMREEDLKMIFGSFTQVDTKRNRSMEGTGLGLAISQRLVNLMEGEITVTSKFGEGSVFSFYVVNDVVDASPIGRLEEAFQNVEPDVFRPDFTAPDAKILVVDDNTINLRLVEGLLRAYDIQPVSVESGRDAFRAFDEQGPFDIIFMDHMMPGMDGVEAMQILREKEGGREVPIIALTANALSGAKTAYLEAGFDGFLAKPIEMKKLDDILRKYLKKK